jgi:hypothetical protein
MAYSDYGGYAYKNGERVVERSDAVLTPEGLKSTPGSWPGWSLEEGRSGGSYHVILGNDGVYVTMYKQSSLGILNLNEPVDLLELMREAYPESIKKYDFDPYKDQEYVDWDLYEDKMVALEVSGHKIEIYREESDNYYQYVRLTQPNGDVWTGFSGYGVGAGLEDCGYGFSTSDQEERLQNLFPNPHESK